MEPQTPAAIVPEMDYRSRRCPIGETARPEPMPCAAPGEDEAAYAAGWTISGLATLGAILAVWVFAI